MTTNILTIDLMTDVVPLILLLLFCLFMLFLLIVLLLKKLYVMQKFTEHGYGLYHLGFKGKQPFHRLCELLIVSKPVYDIRLNDWRYSIYDTQDRIRSVLGIDPFDQVVFIGAAFKSYHIGIARVVERIPHHERESDGYFSILLQKHNDQVLNFYCPFYRLYHYLELPNRAVVRLSIVPHFAWVYDNEKKIKKLKLRKSKGSSDIITGHSRVIFNVVEFLGKQPSAAKSTIYACGEVVNNRKLVNNYTNKVFYVTTIDVGTALLDIISRRRTHWKLPKQGEFIAVNGQLLGYIEKILE